jgi:hypothetical protein
MPRSKVVELPLLTGAVTDDTVLASRFYATDMDKVRARGKRWETVKGWKKFHNIGMTEGIARGIHAYSDLQGNPVLVAASRTAVDAWVGGTEINITPVWKDIWLAGSAKTAQTDTIVTLKWDVYQPSTNTSAVAPHDLIVGDVLSIYGAIDVSGTPVFVASFSVVEIVDEFQFKIDMKLGTLNPPGPFVVTVKFRTGLVDGTGDTPATRPRAWSIPWENAVFCGSDGTPVFYWQPTTVFPNPNLISNSTLTFLPQVARWRLPRLNLGTGVVSVQCVGRWHTG